MALAAQGNRYVEETTPWKLAKSGDDAALDSVLANLVRTVGRLALLAGPFIPEKAAEVWRLLGNADWDTVRLEAARTPDFTGRHLLPAPILFPKPQAQPAAS
jgi:methionyl-tRNA synthetase